MAARKEIITLQFGHFSNFIGTHWWNTQELGFDYTGTVPSEIDHDVLFREGETRNGEVTYTPRLLLVDINDSLGRLPEHGGLYEDEENPDRSKVDWESSVEIVQKQTENQEANEFQTDLKNEDKTGVQLKKLYNLDGSVNVWSDYLRTRYHPRSIHIIKKYTHTSDTNKFDAFTQGTSLWNDHEFEDKFVDELRKYSEECDVLQGFHVLVDATDGFGGLASSAITYLSDEYNRKSIFAFPSSHAYYPDTEANKEGLRLANFALCLQGLSTNSDLIVPLSTSRTYWQQKSTPRDFEYLEYNPALPYHTSSILAATLDCITLRYRLKNSIGGGLSDIIKELSLGGRKAISASVSLPFPLQEKAYLLETLEELEGPLWQSVSSCCDLGQDRVWAQSVVLRGISNTRLKSPEAANRSCSGNPAYTSNNVEEMLKYYLECTCSDTPSHVTTINSSYHVSAPFPHIFNSKISCDGYIGSEPRQENIGVNKVPVLAGLHASRSMGAMLSSLQAQAKGYHWRKLTQLSETGLERDDYNESLENLLTFADCYNEEFEV